MCSLSFSHAESEPIEFARRCRMASASGLNQCKKASGRSHLAFYFLGVAPALTLGAIVVALAPLGSSLEGKTRVA